MEIYLDNAVTSCATSVRDLGAPHFATGVASGRSVAKTQISALTQICGTTLIPTTPMPTGNAGMVTFGAFASAAGWLAPIAGQTHVHIADHAVRPAAKQAGPPRGVPR